MAAGLAEAVTYSFAAADVESATAASPLACRGEAVPVLNPISSRLAVLRRSLLAGLVEAAAGNLRRGAGRVAIAEVGRAFFATSGHPREEERLAIALAGERRSLGCSKTARLPRSQGAGSRPCSKGSASPARSGDRPPRK